MKRETETWREREREGEQISRIYKLINQKVFNLLFSVCSIHNGSGESIVRAK